MQKVEAYRQPDSVLIGSNPNFFANVTDLQKKEIEQDIPPVGFIDDGSEYMQQIEQQEQGWIQQKEEDEDYSVW